MKFDKGKTKDYYLFTTDVENVYINEYMTEAPGEYVKAYLYGLFCSEHGMELKSALMAEVLHMDEDRLRVAWEYWERMNVVAIEEEEDDYTVVFLSLREQEFMIAAEATGLKTSRRIFKHLVPNVMPQLIVTATMGMGSVIIMESTLSFLGLGVKHPLATWGTIINSVSSASAMAHYAFIWIPVGLLICLTVIAFNFVGDGLRDAYDPKSKR